MPKIGFAALMLLILLATAPVNAADPIPPMVGASETALKERAELFVALAAAKSEPDARAIEQKIWKFWLGFADAQSRAMLEQSRAAQLRLDLDEALDFMKRLVVHAPQFAEGWNQLGFVCFLAGQYDDALAAIEQALKLEPMHFAALSGRSMILMQQGKEAEARAALKQALAIDPWLRDRPLIEDGGDRKL